MSSSASSDENFFSACGANCATKGIIYHPKFGAFLLLIPMKMIAWSLLFSREYQLVSIALFDLMITFNCPLRKCSNPSLSLFRIISPMVLAQLIRANTFYSFIILSNIPYKDLYHMPLIQKDIIHYFEHTNPCTLFYKPGLNPKTSPISVSF